MKRPAAKKKEVQNEVSIAVRAQKKQARFKRVRQSGGPDMAVSEFFFLLDISAKKDAYIPISIASSKKPTGFVYEIEGTEEGAISTTNISCSGAGITQITLGTLLYCKIPAGKTATFRILIEIRGKVGQEYKTIINSINYKSDPSDARYEKFSEEIVSKTLKTK